MFVLKIFDKFGEFAENKNKAKKIRERILEPRVNRGEIICLDFESVNNATQSFVHALISNLLRKYGIDVLDQIEFKNCNETLQTIITIVIDYMQDSIDLDENIEET